MSRWSLGCSRALGRNEVARCPHAKGARPFSLRDAPALIESVFPAQKIGVEAQKERKAGAGQTLTALGSYWKGRKPLVLVRACVLASLLPASDDPEADLEVFEALMAVDFQGLSRRAPKVTPDIIATSRAVPRVKWEPHIEIGRAAPGEPDENTEDERSEGAEAEEAPPRAGKAKWRRLDLSHIKDPAQKRVERARIEEDRDRLKTAAFVALPFARQVLGSNTIRGAIERRFICIALRQSTLRPGGESRWRRPG